ncbi:MAG TPA: S8 family serine peptidase [Thermoleptolyngbya sp. M55_K2018_002]|nr:S8 family serine peptidase [Thermoleptolyngbya sp. M55_K2018_002]
MPDLTYASLPDTLSADLPGLSSGFHLSGLAGTTDGFSRLGSKAYPQQTAFSARYDQDTFKNLSDIDSISGSRNRSLSFNLSISSSSIWDSSRFASGSLFSGSFNGQEGGDRPSFANSQPGQRHTSKPDALTGLADDDGLVATATRSRRAGGVNAQQTIHESLSRWDARNPTRPNTYKDDYRLQSTTGGQVQLDLTSGAFDAYLQIVDSRTGRVIAANDDGGGGTNARLTLNLQAGVGYIVRVTSYWANETGNYSLTLSAPNAQPPANGFNSTYGYGLVNAAAAVAQSIGRTPFTPVADAGHSWSNNLVNAPEVWAQGYTGRNVVVAVVDTGVDYTHSDLDANIWRNTREIAGNGIDDDGNGFVDDVRGWNFANGNNNPMDVNGHGTHVAGTIAAENNGTGITGVAYNAQIMPVKVLGDDGSGTNLSVARGIRYAADNGANVINLSLGGGYSSDIESAIAHAVSRGAIVVMAAGNEGAARPSNPASLAIQYGVSVGAIDSSGNLASFSNRAGTDSRMQHVVAPGVNILSTRPGGRYQSLNGTSMATPHVAGVVALMRQANPNLTDAQVRQILTSSAIRASSSLSSPVDPAPLTLTLVPRRSRR